MLKYCILHLIILLSLASVPLYAEETKCVLNENSPSISQKFEDIGEKADQALTQIKKWQFTDDEESYFSEIMEDKSQPIARRISNLYQALTAARMTTLSPRRRAFIKKGLKDIFEQKSLYSKSLGILMKKWIGPHYDPISNRVSMDIKDAKNPSPTEVLIAQHESEHLIHRNEKPLPFIVYSLVALQELTLITRIPISPLLIRHIEARAIAAQWELASRIPDRERTMLIHEMTSQRFKRGKTHHQLAYEAIFISTLKHAHLDKLTFLKIIGELQGYDLKNIFKQRYKMNFRKWMLTAYSLSVLAYYSLESHPTHFPLGYDIKLLWHSLSFLFGG